MIHETTHTETFVVDDAVTEVHTVDAFVNHLVVTGGVVNEDGVTRSRVDMAKAGFDVESVLGVVDSIRIHVRTLEEVDTDRRRLCTISLRFTATVDGGAVVTITETASNVATYIVVPAVAEVNIGPRREVSARQSIS